MENLLKNKLVYLKKSHELALECLAHAQSAKPKNVVITFGAELEFYLDTKKTSLDQLSAEFGEFCKDIHKNGHFFDQIEQEDGENQLEIQTKPTADPVDLAHKIHSLQEFLINHGCILDSKPFSGMPGSSTHYHIGAYKIDGSNLFAHKPFLSNTYKRSDIFLQSIAGMLATMQECMIFFAPTHSCYNRFKLPQSNELFFYPTKISWGQMNRTCAIRIPTSIKQHPNKTRLEHRVCSSMANPFMALTGILYGMHYGLKNNPHLQEETFGNAFDSQYYQLERLSSSLDESKRFFNQSGFELFLKQYGT